MASAGAAKPADGGGQRKKKQMAVGHDAQAGAPSPSPPSPGPVPASLTPQAFANRERSQSLFGLFAPDLHDRMCRLNAQRVLLVSIESCLYQHIVQLRDATDLRDINRHAPRNEMALTISDPRRKML